ncbi:hypothetical protein F0225_06755 [Vibrio pectenicida]|uniref:GH18 domain-containing protein n=1 Tax=Vibrio pectenicida TaxID=62763 RepID=A0A7Y3ZXR7_9VIBR|nr:glycosyl hydrolase family 18 protein [Vibrio pectenicida]NOH71040.1 hypothetical protein [Vibrio pectenicida]
MKKLVIFLASVVGVTTLSVQSTTQEKDKIEPEHAIVYAINRAHYSNHYKKDREKPLLTAYLSARQDFSLAEQVELNELAKYDVVMLPFDISTKTAIIPVQKKSLAEEEMDSLAYIKMQEKKEKESYSLQLLKKLHKINGTEVGIIIRSKNIFKGKEERIINIIDDTLLYNDFIKWVSIDYTDSPFNKLESESSKKSISQLRNKLSAHNIRINIASNVPRNEKEAKIVKELLDLNKVDKWYFSAQSNDRAPKHHSNLFTKQSIDWSVAQAITFLLDSGIEPNRLELEYSNTIHPHSSGQNLTTHDMLDTMLEVSQSESVTGKNGYYLKTEPDNNVDFICKDNDVGKADCFSVETPRMIAVKAQFVLDKGLGGLFTRNVFADAGLNLNAAREGLEYEVTHQTFAMNPLITKSEGINHVEHSNLKKARYDQLNTLVVDKYNKLANGKTYSTLQKDTPLADDINGFLEHLVRNYPMPLTYNDAVTLKHTYDRLGKEEVHGYLETLTEVKNRLGGDIERVEPTIYAQDIFDSENQNLNLACNKIAEFRALATKKGKWKEFLRSEKDTTNEGHQSEIDIQLAKNPKGLLATDWIYLELQCLDPAIDESVTKAFNEVKRLERNSYPEVKSDMFKQHISNYINRKIDNIYQTKVDKYKDKFDIENSQNLDDAVLEFKKNEGTESVQSFLLQTSQSILNTTEKEQLEQLERLLNFRLSQKILLGELDFDLLSPYQIDSMVENIISQHFPLL